MLLLLLLEMCYTTYCCRCHHHHHHHHHHHQYYIFCNLFFTVVVIAATITGITYSFIRDCTNNTIGTYSFPITGRLHLLKPNNVTVCMFNVETLGQECISLCESDFCNGPNSGAVGLLPPGPTGLYISIILTLAVFVPDVRFVNLYL